MTKRKQRTHLKAKIVSTARRRFVIVIRRYMTDCSWKRNWKLTAGIAQSRALPRASGRREPGPRRFHDRHRPRRHALRHRRDPRRQIHARGARAAGSRNKKKQ